VLTSETLEHIPDWQTALKEIYRVLKPGGEHVFTIPALLNRKTRERVVLKNGKLVNIMKKSYHGCTRRILTDDYIVCTEFGADIISILDNIGFETRLHHRNFFRLSDPNFVFVCKKVKKEF
jgi:ubiquinone/menaquinone biosynthesis C-methylase UbiE